MSSSARIAGEEAHARALRGWGIDPHRVSIEALGSGHIHRSLRIRGPEDSSPLPAILQRVNPTVFGDASAVMANLSLVLTHLRDRAESRGENLSRVVPALVPTLDGNLWYTDPEGVAWRLFREIEGTETLLAPDSPERARSASFAFGRFQADLGELPPEALVEVLPDFHHTPKRYRTFEHALEGDVVGRASGAAAEIDFALRHRDLASTLLDLATLGDVPVRAVHNDAKIANVLFDQSSGEALCAIDYDTVMPGVALFDFGDLVRSMATRAKEDEPDLSKVVIDGELLTAVVDGYLQGANGLLTATERNHLLEGALVITLEQGVRFLSDYLAGDHYYAIDRPEHNLDRCRVQFALVEALESFRDAFPS